MFLRSIVFLIFTFLGLHLCAQDTTQALQEVAVVGDRLQKFGVGTKIQTIDSANLHRFANTNLSEILAQQTGVFIKNYGIGNLASVAFRGTNASQTAVLWNGINLQSAMLGQVDFALLPANFVSELKVQHGGASALYGSGAIGGAIHLNNKSSYNAGLTATAGSSGGSFGQWQQNISLKYGQQKWSSSIQFFHKNATNNFPFRTNSGATVRQTNAHLKQFGVLQENYVKLTSKQEINLLVWYQSTDRQIPPAMESSSSKATQLDQSWRVSSQWKRQGEKITWIIRSALLTEKLNYIDYFVSLTDAISTVTEGESTIKIAKNQSCNIGINHTRQQVASNNYAQTQQLNRSSIFANYKIQNPTKTWLAALGIRKEFVTGFSSPPLTPFAGFEGKVFRWVSFLGNVSRNYRVPTLNDLYWQDAGAVGNINLRPEYGWTGDLGTKIIFPIQSAKENAGAKVELSCNYFTSYLYNSIQWQPIAGGRWTPENIQEVYSRGVESQTSLSHAIGKVFWKISVSTNYVVSTNEKAKSATDGAYKMQLIYTPIYNHQGNITVAWKQWRMNYNQTYTGYRFTATDNSTALPPYWLGNVQVGYDMVLKMISLNTFLQINNVGNAQYQVVQNYAMPSINFQVGFKINFNKKNA